MRPSHHLLMQLAREHERESQRKAKTLSASAPDTAAPEQFAELMQRCFPTPAEGDTAIDGLAAVVPHPAEARRGPPEAHAITERQADPCSEGGSLTARKLRRRSSTTTAAG